MTATDAPRTTTGHEVNTPVEHPVHYNVDPSGVECIEIVRHRNFNVGNGIKYLWRGGFKDSPDKSARDALIEDYEKAVWYIQDEIQRIKNLVPDAPAPASRVIDIRDLPPLSDDLEFDA